jgi:HEAT repeat protein
MAAALAGWYALRARLLRVATRQRLLAEDAGLQALQQSGTAVRGAYDGLSVAITSRGLIRSGTRVRVEGLASGIDVRRAADRPDGPWSDYEIGDAELDALLVLGGSTVLLRALFDEQTRVLAREVCRLDGSVAVAYGELIACFEEPVWRRPRVTAADLRRVLALAGRLRADMVPEVRLADIVRGDPSAVVRTRAIEALVSIVDNPPSRPATVDALRAALLDPDAAVRLTAAREVGETGLPVLHRLAADAVIDDRVSAEAIAELGGHLTFARVRPILDAALAADRIRTACAALKALGRGSGAEADVIADVLARTMGSGAPGPGAHAIAIAAADALADTREPSAEGALLSLLASDAVDVSAAAASALGRIGTAAAIAPLHEAEARGWPASVAARAAIAAIQSRLTGATPGQVSLAGASGELSVVDAADGRVSLDEGE